MKLSVLDVHGLIEETIEHAPVADKLDYERYWLTEHPPQPSVLLSVAIVAGLTERIRVGSAGIMFHYHAPLRTAHELHFLESLYTGRIDGGFCGALAHHLPDDELEGRPVKALVDSYADRVDRLVRYVRNTPGSAGFEPGIAWPGTLAVPPPLWSLGGGMRSAVLAARHGISYAYSLLYKNSVDDPECVARYRTTFVAGRAGEQAQAVVAVCGVCAETDTAAETIAAPLRERFFDPRIVGSPRRCRDELAALAERYAVEEIVFAELTEGADARKRALALLRS